MSTDLRDLYQEVILDHQKSPRNFHAIQDPDCQAHGENPLCGDTVTVYLKHEDGVVTEVSFQGVGCAICTSSASMMTTLVRGKSIDEVLKLFGSFHALLTDETEPGEGVDSLGKLRIFAGVRSFPVRVKCATLPWHTLRAAVEGTHEAVTTE